MLQAISLSKSYNGVRALDSLDLLIEPGQIFCLLGANGAGKTTTINLFLNFIKASAGQALVDGMDAAEHPLETKKRLAYIPEQVMLYRNLSGLENVEYFTALAGREGTSRDQLRQLLLQSGLPQEAIEQRVSGYSKGMRQRIKLAQAICHEPDVLVLDEPLNGLDPQARAEVTEVFREFGATGAHVLISSHILHEVDAISDRVVFLDNGYVIAEGDAPGIKGELKQYPMQVFVRSEHAPAIASRLFELGHVTEVRLHDDGAGLFARTPDADRFFLAFNRLSLAEAWHVEAIGTADETVEAIYNYLVVDGAAGAS